MTQNTKIEWSHHTANLWLGCAKVHAGCDHCYAEKMSHWLGRDIWGNDKPRMEVEGVWKQLEKYQRDAAAAGEVHRVFVGSMMDIFEKPMPLIDQHGTPAICSNDGSLISNEHLRERLFDLVIPTSPNLQFLLLTKRPSNINKYIPPAWKKSPPENVMFGCSVSDQQTADTLIVQLAKVAGKRFVSIEPQLSPVDLTSIAIDGDTANGRLIDWLDWVIVGGESGPRKRAFHPDWARQIRDDCKVLNVPFFMKQVDKVQEIPADLMIREFPLMEPVS